jgi:hypothetical protein
MHAAGCSTQLRAAPAGACLRAPRARCSAAGAAGRARVVRVAAEESMTDAYARIRESRRRSKEKYERQEKLEKAGAFGKLFAGVVGGASRSLRALSARPCWQHAALRCTVLHGCVLPALPAAAAASRVVLRRRRALCGGGARAASVDCLGPQKRERARARAAARRCAPHPRHAARPSRCCCAACAGARRRTTPRCTHRAQLPASNGRGARSLVALSLRLLARPL